MSRVIFTTIMKGVSSISSKKELFFVKCNNASLVHENMSTNFSNMFNGELIVKHSMYPINALSLMINLLSTFLVLEREMPLE